MAKKLLAIIVACVMMFGFALPATALQSMGEQALEVAAADDVVVYVEGEGQEFYQGAGTTWVYDIGGLSDNGYEDDWRIDITSVSGLGSVRWAAVEGSGSCLSITAEKAGRVTVACTFWTEYDEERSDETHDWTETPLPQSETHAFVIDVLALKNTSGTLEKCVDSSSYSTSKAFTFKISDLPADAEIERVSDSNKNGGSWISGVAKGKVSLYVYGTGTHNIKLKAYGKTITCKAVLRTLGVKKTPDVKNTGSLVTYPGRKSVVGVTLSGVKNPKVTWKSTNSKIAQVNKKGIVKANGKGRCYLKAQVSGATVKVLVEVTSREAFQAVNNGFADMRTKLTYSQPNRMARDCRDCSSFVSRCYYDPSLGRYAYLIGGSGAASWAYNAAAQAQWLESHGKRIAWGACSVKKLRPGDTIYFETDYAGKDASQWRYIDHAALYVGNGLYLNTGGYGGKGTVGLARYGYGNVKFIGRPCS